MSLEGKAALITGSTSGIGLGIAEEMAKAGCNIIMNGLGEPEVIRKLQDCIAKYGGRVRYIEADVSNPIGCRALMNQTLEEYGGLDILVNNAGIQHVAPVEDFAAERWDAVLATNLSSAFHLIAAAVPTMRSKGYGRIINIASVHGLVGSENKSAYVASKHGLVGLTKVVALETARHGITCNAICPGWVVTPSSKLRSVSGWNERALSDRSPSNVCWKKSSRRECSHALLTSALSLSSFAPRAPATSPAHHCR